MMKPITVGIKQKSVRPTLEYPLLLKIIASRKRSAVKKIKLTVSVQPNKLIMIRPKPIVSVEKNAARRFVTYVSGYFSEYKIRLVHVFITKPTKDKTKVQKK